MSDEISALLLRRLSNARYWKDVQIVKVWKSNHSVACDEQTCPHKSSDGYWHARFTANGRKYHWFYSHNKRRWYASRMF